MAFQAKHTDHAGSATADSINLTGIADTFRNQFAAALLRNRNIVFFKAVVVDITEVHIIELHTAQLLQLFFYAAAHFQSNLQNLLQIFFGKLTVRIDQFQKAIHCPAHSYGIALIQILA